MSHDGSTPPTASKSDSGEGGDEDTVKCANRCGKSGTKRCAGCKAVMYCSPACQREHWSKGGHKAACKAVRTPASKMATGRTTDSRAKTRVDSANACIICLDADPPPIQSGCACRGDAGLAHVKCRAEAAVHFNESTESYCGWTICGTCGQEFTGAMMVGLGKEWWDKVKHLPDENRERLAASGAIVNTLIHAGMYAHAEALERETLVTIRRVFGAEHQMTLAAIMNLAHTLDSQGKHSEAEAMFREVLEVQRRILGPEDPATLRSGANLANALARLDKLTDAETMYREVLTVQRRVLGPEHIETLQTGTNLAAALGRQGKNRDAEEMYREALAVQRRVLGPENPATLQSCTNLAVALNAQDKFAEVKAFCQEVLPVQRRVFGPRHPDTVRTARLLALLPI